MELYVGLDVSLEETSICVMDRTGSITAESITTSDPEAAGLRSHGSGLVLHRSNKSLVRAVLQCWAKSGR